jgi:hypothetical protein
MVVAISSDGNYGAAAALGDEGAGTDSGTVTMYKRNTATDQWSQLQTENIPSGAASYDRFGSTISLSSDGQALTIGCQLADRGGQTAAGMVSTWRFNGSTYSYVGEITNPRGNTSWAEWSSGETEKGMYMAGNGLNMIVGTKLYNSSRGIVDLYSRSAITNNWTFYGTISPTIHTHATLYFGASVAMSSDGKIVVVGAYLAQNTVYREGAAYVYEYTGSADGIYSGGSWVHRSTLLSPTPESSGHFGQKVEISGDANYVLIGEANDDVGGVANVGGAHVYVRSGNAWNFQQSLIDPDASELDHLGKSISINSDGTHILAGVPNDDGPTGNFQDAGKVLHFKRTDTTWAYSATIYAPTPAAQDAVGANSGVAISGDGSRALLGREGFDTPYTDNGQLLYYTFADATIVDASTQVFTATGTGIVSGSTVQLEGADGTLYSVVDATAPNAAGTQVTFKMGTLGVSSNATIANQPYKVKVNSTSGLTGTSTAKIGFPVTWTTAVDANLNFDTDASTTHTLEGTDGGGGTNRKFEVAPGSNALPAKVGGGTLALTEAGVISGQIAANQDGVTTSVTFRLTDTATGLFTDRAVNIVGTSGLYAFTSPFTFTNAGIYGRTGPTLSQLRTAYSPSWTDYTSNFNVSSGIQLWTVPKTGSYRIAAYGSGSRATNQGGYGARITGTCTLTKDEVIYILVGQTCINATSSGSHGGGGGTFVVRTPYNTNASIIVIAGGGGGGHSYAHGSYGAYDGNASLTTSGTGGQAPGTYVAGGTGGNAGTSGYDNNQGAGFFTGSTTASSFTSGGVGGNYSTDGQGGFGGGGRHGITHGGGGGGYSGGGGSSGKHYVGGGGGSYKATSFTVTSEDVVNDGPGSVTITQL